MIIGILIGVLSVLAFMVSPWFAVPLPILTFIVGVAVGDRL